MWWGFRPFRVYCLCVYVCRQIGFSSRRDSVIHGACLHLLSASPCVTRHPTSQVLFSTRHRAWQGNALTRTERESKRRGQESTWIRASVIRNLRCMCTWWFESPNLTMVFTLLPMHWFPPASSFFSAFLPTTSFLSSDSSSSSSLRYDEWTAQGEKCRGCGILLQMA